MITMLNVMLLLACICCMETGKVDQENTQSTANYSSVTTIDAYELFNGSNELRVTNLELLYGGSIVIGIVWFILVLYLILVMNLFRDFRNWFTEDEEVSEEVEVSEEETSL